MGKTKGFLAGCRCASIATVWIIVLVVPGLPSAKGRDKLNSEGVSALLSVMDTVAALYPGFEQKTEAYDRLPEAEREAVFVEVRQRNDKSDALRSAIQAMLETETYQIYFRRFRNVTPELVTDILLDLPYRVHIAAPGGIGHMFYELLRKRHTIRSALDRVLTEVDMDWVYETAKRWAPESDRQVPPMFLIYDSNAGSFTAQGIPFLNIYNSKLEMQSSEPDDSVIREFEGIMAHELQHVLAEPYLYPASSTDRSWQQMWVDRLTRGMVGEGVAMHCNPPQGIKKEIFEDEKVVAALIRRINDVLGALSRNEMTEDEMRKWYRANYFEVAEDLLRRHLEQRYSGKVLEARLQEHMPKRPDLEHALGWWMVSRISGEGTRREAAVSLLLTPYPVYSLYNEATSADREELRISPEAIRYLRSFHDAPESDHQDD